jgi:hypothetical protein
MMEITNIQIAQEKASRMDFTNSEYNRLLDVSVLNTLEYAYAVFEACGMLGVHPIIERNVDYKTKSMMIVDIDETASVYPNPASNMAIVNYQFVDEQGGSMLLYSIDGKLVKKSRLIAGVNEMSINIANIEEGIYIYSVYSDSGALVSKGKLVILR